FLSFLYKLLLTVCKVFTLHTVSKSFKLNIDLIDSNHDIFLDLKLHDIPNTVKKAMKALAHLGVGMVNVHAQGGRKMMEAAREGLEQGTPPGQTRPRLIAVTQLTSLSKETFKEEQKSIL